MDLSVEEANKIRIAMGMKPLPVPGGAANGDNAGPTFKDSKHGDNSDDEPASTLESRQAQSYDNWKNLQDEAEAKAKREAQKAAIKKAREKAQRFALLEGKGLADEEEDMDARSWLMGSKKRQKKIDKARKLQEELEEREKQAEATREYTEKDLAGIKVAHELGDFDEGDEIIVNLKDTAVDAEDEDDELEATQLREKERQQEKLDSKKRKRAYDPNDTDQTGQGSILAQYDEEIDGKKRKAFTLDGKGRTVEELQMASSEASKPRKLAISLDILKDDAPVNDYKDVSEVKIRKPKKSKSKSKKKKATDDDIFPVGPTEEEEEMEIDNAPAKPKKSIFDESFVDDDDLQANLAAQRRAALKKRKRTRPEDLARQLQEEASVSPAVMDTTEDAEEPGLVIDETTEFVANLQRDGPEEERPSRKPSKTPNATTPAAEAMSPVDAEGDVDMEQSYANVDDEQERKERSISQDIGTTGLEEEKTISQGMGATLSLLKQRGLIAESSSADLNAHYRDRQRFLADKQRAEAAADRLAKEQRERDRRSGKLDHMTTREREEYARRMNTQRDQYESRKLAEIFNKEYKPNVELTYSDEHGRSLTQKEAFKSLSHQFHGKGSGNTKTQKHLDKIKKEKDAMKKSLLDASQQQGMSNAQTSQSKKHKTAGVRLQ